MSSRSVGLQPETITRQSTLCTGTIAEHNSLSEQAYAHGHGERADIVGIGGLGNLPVLFAKALKGDKNVAITRSSSKKADAMSMGADEFIATEEELNWWNNNADTLDLIILTVSGKGFELEEYLSILDVDETMIQVRAPEDPIPASNAFALLWKGAKIRKRLIRSQKTAREMLQLAVRANVGA